MHTYYTCQSVEKSGAGSYVDEWTVTVKITEISGFWFWKKVAISGQLFRGWNAYWVRYPEGGVVAEHWLVDWLQEQVQQAGLD